MSWAKLGKWLLRVIGQAAAEKLAEKAEKNA